LIHNLVNLGDTRTLAVHPASTICRDMDVMERSAMGVTDDIVRLAVGIEHVNDLITNIGQSLSTV
jgi:O-acetylhomoserine (thiol)-lyase